MANEKLKFTCDYMEGAHPLIMNELLSTNMMQTSGYGLDEFSASARDKIRKACEAPDAGVYFLVGGTQTNATVIDALLRSYQGVLCAETGHIAVHEAGAIEFGGHKVLPLPHTYGKISATQISSYMDTFLSDETHEHMVMPGMVYISQPTEYGTLYSLEELTALSEACRRYHLPLYVDGARLAYALAAPENTVSLKDLARLCDVFGGTKCGAFFGEAVVIPDPALIPHFFTIVKQHGALFAKGRILGIQFDVLFTDDLYLHIGESALNYADSIKNVLKENGYQFFLETPTNQIFIILEDEILHNLEESAEFSFWEKYDENHTVVRFATSWATKKEEYIKKKGNTTGEFQWKIYEKYNGIKKLKAGFVNEMEAREYASFLENCNRMAGYNGSRFSIEYGCPVSEAQEEYDIWKAQFPKSLERTEIRHN